MDVDGRKKSFCWESYSIKVYRVQSGVSAREVSYKFEVQVFVFVAGFLFCDRDVCVRNILFLFYFYRKKKFEKEV